MVKMSIFDKTDDLLIVNASKMSFKEEAKQLMNSRKHKVC